MDLPSHDSDIYRSLFVQAVALCPNQLFFSHRNTFSWVESVLGNEDKVSCSKTQHPAASEILTSHLLVRSLVLYQLSYSTPQTGEVVDQTLKPFACM